MRSIAGDAAVADRRHTLAGRPAAAADADEAVGDNALRFLEPLARLPDLLQIIDDAVKRRRIDRLLASGCGLAEKAQYDAAGEFFLLEKLLEARRCVMSIR